ncbi:MAG: NAD(P)/FAD-dependent oxidoreductase [Lachnospiraceae bacterium]|nr:NAD(P)/FAD-dependent oxidoreductase [Lachnospiraceae bacterium]
MAKVRIIGGGPAGVSAALYTARAQMETTLFTTGRSALKKAEKIENYYGFSEPVTGQSLEASGLDGAKRLGVEIREEEVVGLYWEDGLIVRTSEGDYPADCVILATGTSRLAPSVPDLKEYEGKGVSYCAVCDGFFYRKKPVAVLGNGEYAAAEAKELLPLASSVTILTDGNEPEVPAPEGAAVDTRKIAGLRGEGKLDGIVFEEGEALDAAGLFVAWGIAGSAALAKKIGALTEGNRIRIDENMATNVPGLYAAGDCTGGLLQIAKAVYEGAKAGTEAVRFLRARGELKRES